MAAPPSTGTLRRLSQPRSWTTVTPSPSASVSASTGVARWVARSEAEPPPMIWARGVGADDRHRAQGGPVEGQQPVVGQQDHRLGGRPPGHRPVLGSVGGHVVAGVAAVEGAQPVEHREQAGDLGVHQPRRPRRPARPPPARGRRPGPAPASPGRRLRPRTRPCRHPEPVGDHEAVEASSEDARQQLGGLGAPPPVEAVVGGHHAERSALGHRQLEGPQVDLPQARSSTSELIV